MLEHLHVKNVALIEELDVDFCEGLNILSGETGAGKSILIDSINFVLGGRCGKDFIRSGEDSAAVDLLVSLQADSINDIAELGVEADEENSLLISRVINSAAKSVCRVNGRVIPVGMLRELSAFLVDVHGQHEHQSLLQPAKHGLLLDTFCEDKLSEPKAKLQSLLKNYREIKKQMQDISGDERERSQKIDLLSFQTEEIRAAKLKQGEEEELAERKKILNNTEKLRTKSYEAFNFLYGGESDELSAIDKLSKAIGAVGILAELDAKLMPLTEVLESALGQLDDASRQLREYYEAFEQDDPNELNDIENRLNIIYQLKRKYGSTIPEILQFCKKQEKMLSDIVNSEEEILRLTKERGSLEKEMNVLCERISGIRRESAEKIKKDIAANLRDLGMKNASFDILFDKKEISAEGFDKIEFLISANQGEPLKPLSKIASGGEMSRVMLAMKTVLAESDNIETFIFDEIDTGVSGRTAQKVAEKLKLIAKGHQILCITHLPQIAAMADHNYLIEKRTAGDKTVSTVTKLNYDNIIEEIARLIGGAKITDATISAAREMKQLTDVTI